jgi:UDP-glucose 4-epimerase
MAILVAGGAGYIGSVTVELLRAAGERVVVLDNLVRGHRPALAADIPFYQGKIGDRALLERIAAEHELESCIHFAALAYVGESVKDPAWYYENNVEQSIAMMSTLLHVGVRRVVFSSTAATYGDAQHIPISENEPQWPVNPYGWSKLFMERLLHSYDVAYGLKFVALRYFNAAGATETCGEHHEPEAHLIPNILLAAKREPPEVPVFGNNYPTPDGTAIRDYVHVVDLADAHIRALAHMRRGGASDFLNLGTGHGYSVMEVIEAARKVTGREIRVRLEPPRAGDPPSLVADPARAKSVLGWVPAKSDLHTIIDSAWRWHQRHPGGYDSEPVATR